MSYDPEWEDELLRKDWNSIAIGNQLKLETCPLCSALVYNRITHLEWHKKHPIK